MKAILRFIMLFFLTLECAVMASTMNTVTFEASASPGFLEFDGEGAAVEGKPKYSNGELSGTFYCDLSKFKTGLSLRDRHMREKYLEVDKYPKAKFVMQPTKVKSKMDVKGKLTLHGVTKSVIGKGTVKKVGDDRVLTVKLPLVLSEYNIDIPSYMGVTVAKDVDVIVRVSL